MKTVVITEGKNDNIFMKKMTLDKLKFNEAKIKFYNQKDNAQKADKKHEEHILLGSFFEKHSPYETLIKAEGGKGMAADVLVYALMPLCKIKTIIVVDLDSGTLDNFLAKLCEKIDTKRGNSLDVTHKIINEDEHLITAAVSIKLRDDPRENLPDGFLVTAFKRSLEIECGIAASDNSRTVETKIDKLLNGNELIVNHFSSHLRPI